MSKFLIVFAALLTAAGSSYAASAVNKDSEPRTLVVTEGAERSELLLGSGETTEFCASGCFVTMPNGDRQALTGGETIEILDGVARIK